MPNAYMGNIYMQCVERSLVPKGQNFSTTHVQLLQWLHGKQQQPNYLDSQGGVDQAREVQARGQARASVRAVRLCRHAG